MVCRTTNTSRAVILTALMSVTTSAACDGQATGRSGARDRQEAEQTDTVDAAESGQDTESGSGSGSGADSGSGSEPAPKPDLAVQGTLQGRGDFEWGPPQQWTEAGVHEGSLQGSVSADFDLYLHMWDDGEWLEVASSTWRGSEESVTYEGSPGHYIWRVHAKSGRGDYELRFNVP